MLLLDEYHQTLQAISDMEAYLQESRYTQESIDCQIEELEDAKTKLSEELKNSKESILKRYKQEKIDQGVAPINNELRELTSQLTALRAAYKDAIDVIGREVDVRYNKYDSALNHIHKTVVECGPAFEGMLSEQSLTEERKKIHTVPMTLSQLKNVERMVLSLKSDALELQSKPKIEQFVEKLILKSFINRVDNPVIGLLVYSAYLSILIILMYSTHGLFLIGYFMISLFSVKDIYDKSYKIREVFEPYEHLRAGLCILYESLARERDKEKNEKMNAFEQDRKLKMEKLQRDISNREAQIQDIKDSVMDDTDPEEAITGVNSKFGAEMQSFKAQITDAFGQKDETVQITKEQEQSLAEMRDRKKNLHCEIVNKYMTPESAGESRLLQKSFFLGFNEDETLLEFPYNGESTIIFWSGDNSGVNNAILKMMIMQLFTAMDPSCLDISLVDAWGGGSEFAIFQYKDLEQIFKIYPTSEVFDSLINELHMELLIRNRDIMTIADNIEDFNKKMIESRSLTKDYKFIFIQNGGDTIYSNKKFMQICKNGPRVGIIPIVFIPMIGVRDAILQNNQQKKNGLIELLNSVGDQLYRFTSERASLFHYDSAYKESTIKRLRSEADAIRNQ